MAKVDITFEVDSVKELGSLMYSLGQTEANDCITDIWVDLEHKEEEPSVAINENPDDDLWEIRDQQGNTLKKITTEEVMEGDW